MSEKETLTPQTTDFLSLVRKWQERALALRPPVAKGFAEDLQRRPPMGDLHGPAFFPEGLGLIDNSTAEVPGIVIVGHNFGCVTYRQGLSYGEEHGRTWLGLKWLFQKAEVPFVSCYLTNWFIGLLPGDKQEGPFLLEPDNDYENACVELLLEQLTAIRPRILLLLGRHVVQRAHVIMPRLTNWSAATTWTEIDLALDPVQYNVPIILTDGSTLSLTVVALLHPARNAGNQRFRRTRYQTKIPEAAMLSQAWLHV